MISCAPLLAILLAAAPLATSGTPLPGFADVAMPVAVSFVVTDVSLDASGSPATSVAFSNALILLGQSVRISVRADSVGFTPPSGNSIPAANVAWTTSNAQGGVGSNNVLSSSTYRQVFQGAVNGTSGSVDLSWTVTAPGAAIRAGAHSLVLRWKVESVP